MAGFVGFNIDCSSMGIASGPPDLLTVASEPSGVAYIAVNGGF
jgi:hypothetical protein